MHNLTLVDVSPRDGLQNESQILSPQDRVHYIQKLYAAGVRHIEIGSLVNPKAVPQMQATEAVIEAFQDKAQYPGLQTYVLVPNPKGLERLKDLTVDTVCFFSAGTNSFAKANIGMSVNESLQTYGAMVAPVKERGSRIRAYVSCMTHCPFEGDVNPQQVMEVLEAFDQMGVDEIVLGETTGQGVMAQTNSVIQECLQRMDPLRVGCHFHDTYGQGLANTMGAFALGIRSFDGSTGGLGGCPYAPGAGGNVALEEIIYAFESSGLETGIQLGKLLEAAQEMATLLDQPCRSKLCQAMDAKA